MKVKYLIIIKRRKNNIRNKFNKLNLSKKLFKFKTMNLLKMKVLSQMTKKTIKLTKNNIIVIHNITIQIKHFLNNKFLMKMIMYRNKCLNIFKYKKKKFENTLTNNYDYRF